MKWVILGSSITCTHGHDHASLWRGLVGALARRGHRVELFERAVETHRLSRDPVEIPGTRLHLYGELGTVVPALVRHLLDADVALLASSSPDARRVGRLLAESRAVRVFWDLDPAETLAAVGAGRRLAWEGPRGLRDFDLALGRAPGRALEALARPLGAPRVAPLLDAVESGPNRAFVPFPGHLADLAWFGAPSGSARACEALFLGPARRRPGGRFLLGGAVPDGARPFNVRVLPDLGRPELFSAAALAACPGTVGPPAGLLEAARVGVPVLTDDAEGVAALLQPGFEVLVARTTDQVLEALALDRAELARIGWRARERALADHSFERRVAELEAHVEAATRAPRPALEAAASA